MGNLLRLLAPRDETTVKYNVFVDFENAQPTEREMPVFQQVSEVLQQSPDVLEKLKTYKGAGNEIREAIANPSNDAAQLRAWHALTPLVDTLKEFYLFSSKLESVILKLLEALTTGPMTARQHLERQQSLVKQFSEILDFVLRFDVLKMSNPSVQNDLSYFRRTYSRYYSPQESIKSAYGQLKPNMSLEMTSMMSLFYAHATPMLKLLSDTTSTFVMNDRNSPINNPTEILSTMAKVCQRMIENPEFSRRFQKEDTIFFVLRVMVGVIILYDHIHPSGAFVKTSNVDIKGAIKVLREQPIDAVEGLLNALRYTTKHLNDESTPKSIKQLLN